MLLFALLAMQAAVAAPRVADGNRPPDAPPWPTESTMPPTVLIDKIEAMVNGRKCIGDIHGWERTYWYPSFTDRKSRFWFDFGTIMASYKDRAGSDRADRRIVRANPATVADPADNAGRQAIIAYKVDSGKIRVTFCGVMHVPYD